MRWPSRYSDEVAQDFRVAVRRMQRAPAFTAGIILTIALGLGAAAAIFRTFEAALVYAICMHEVESRRREFGIRLALGCAPAALRRLVVGDALLVGTAGIAVGAVIAVAVSRAMQAVLFGIAATDWRICGTVAAAVLGFATLATLLPALRAGSVNPGVIMRAE